MKNDNIEETEAFECLGGERKGGIRGSRRTGKGKKSMRGVFSEIKTKLVMRVYGVNRRRAQEIIAERAVDARLKSEESGSGSTRRDVGRGRSSKVMTAEEFFGV